MKKLIVAMACAVSVMSFTAQRASAAGDIKDYNRIGISYDVTHYSNYYNNVVNKITQSGAQGGATGDGYGIDYIHGFSVSSKMPLYIETGLNFNYGDVLLDGDLDLGNYRTTYKLKMTNFNMQVPVNVAWKFGISDNFSITPYAGMNFKLHLSSKLKITVEDESLSGSLFDSEKMGDNTWNRFQMGWQVGVGFQYKPIYLGVQYGTDFIHCWSNETSHIGTGNFKMTVAYVF